MRDPSEGTIAEEIDQVSMFRPHVVVLGARRKSGCFPAREMRRHISSR